MAVRTRQPRYSCPPGTLFGRRYQIQGRLGAGGAATVYRCTDLRLRREVAVKVVNPKTSIIPRAAERFVLEARAMAALDSPFLVPIYDVGVDNDRLFLVLKLLDGESLEKTMKRGPIHPRRMATIADNLLEGMEILHAARMIHRDIKPANVFVTAAGRAVLLDLGIVLDEREHALTDRNVVLGTPGYMAPEHACGETCDERSDIYAAALIVLFGVTGQRGGPSSPWHIGTRVHGDDWAEPLLEAVPRDWREPLAHALRRDRAERTGSAAELRARLRAAEIPATWAPPPDVMSRLKSRGVADPPVRAKPVPDLLAPSRALDPLPDRAEEPTAPTRPLSGTDAVPTHQWPAPRRRVRMRRLASAHARAEFGPTVALERGPALGQAVASPDAPTMPQRPLPTKRAGELEHRETDPQRASTDETGVATVRLRRMRPSVLFVGLAFTGLLLVALTLISS